MSEILLVDGHSIANRAYYGLPMMTNSAGVPTNAIYGFLTILLKIIDQTGAQQLAVCFDSSAPTFRHEMYDAYKGGRKPMPNELRAQIPLIQSFLKTAGVEVILHPGLEADDMIGTLAKKHSALGDHIHILSGDRDLLQLVDDNICVVMPSTGKNGSQTIVYDTAGVIEKMGVTPTEYLQVKSLMGDASDNIPGVPSIGEKTATAIISEYHTLENAIAHADGLKPKAAGAKLKEYAEQARLSLTLATICTTADFPEDAANFSLAQLGAPSVVELVKQYEFKSLLARFLGFAEASGACVQEEKREATCPCKTVIVDRLPMLRGPFAYRLFTEGDFWGLAICEEAGKAYWLEGTDGLSLFLSKTDVLAELSAMPGPVIGHDVKADLRDGLRIADLRMDTMIGAYLLNPLKETYAEDELARLFLNESALSDEEFFGTGRNKKKWVDIDPETRAQFGGSRAEIIFRCDAPLRAKLAENEMTSLFEEIEKPLIFVLADMERTGMRVDREALQSFGEALSGEIGQLETKIYDAAGETFNILSPKQLGEILFDKLMLPTLKTTKSGYSTAADVLEKLAPEYEIVRDVLRYRQLTKLKSTYVDGLTPCIAADGKIHCHFNQTVAATGRLSSSEPNMQNIPTRTELGKLLRKAFVPSDDSYCFVDADYSQIELRLLAHMSGDEKMIAAYQQGQDIHRLTAAQVNGKRPEEVTDHERSAAKAVSFGIIYGISAFSLSDDLHISQRDAQAYIERYYQQFPSVRGFLENCVDEAKQKGYAVTLFGRRRPMEELKASNFIQRSFGERVARNMPIQGTAADIMKIAMVRVYRRLQAEHAQSRILLTVHDELLIETKRNETELVQRILTEEMMNAAILKVPLEISLDSGENWYEV